MIMNELKKIRTDFKDIIDFIVFIRHDMLLSIYQPTGDIICIGFNKVRRDDLYGTSTEIHSWIKSNKKDKKELADKGYFQKNPTLYKGFIPSELFDISLFDLNGERN